MVTKKTDKANLENKRVVFFEIGMVLALATALVAIEWCDAETRSSNRLSNTNASIPEELEIQITRPEQKHEIKPPKLQEFKIIDQETDIEEVDFEINVESSWDDDVVYFPEPAEEKPEPMDYVLFAEKMPQYRNGGLENFHKFIQGIVEYPATATEIGLEGKVFVKFVVDKKGYITNIEILQGIHPLLDNAVIAAIQKSERWKPGMQGGIPVNVAMTMPVVFVLQ